MYVLLINSYTSSKVVVSFKMNSYIWHLDDLIQSPHSIKIYNIKLRPKNIATLTQTVNQKKHPFKYI